MLPAARGGAESPGPEASASAPAEGASWAGERPAAAMGAWARGSSAGRLRRLGWDGSMAARGLLEAGLARVLFYPSLLYTVFRGKLPGPAHRDWYHRIDRTVLLGALPLRGMTGRLVRDENVRGVITMNEEYETRFLCNSYKEWKNAGVEQLRLSTVDMTGIPTLANLQKGVQFARKYESLGQCVYVHCKAGRSRSATMVAAYLIQMYKWSPEEAVDAITRIRSHIYIRPGQLEILRQFHTEVTSEAANSESHGTQT